MDVSSHELIKNLANSIDKKPSLSTPFKVEYTQYIKDLSKLKVLLTSGIKK